MEVMESHDHQHHKETSPKEGKEETASNLDNEIV